MLAVPPPARMHHHATTPSHCRWTVLFLVMVVVVVASGILGLQQHHGRIGIQQSTVTTRRSTSVIMDIVEISIDSSTIDFIIISGTSISRIGGSIPVQQ